MSDVLPFPARVTISVDDLARKLAEAQEVGFRAGLTAAGVPDMERNRLVHGQWQMFETLVDLYAAQLGAEMRAGKP